MEESIEHLLNRLAIEGNHMIMEITNFAGQWALGHSHLRVCEAVMKSLKEARTFRNKLDLINLIDSICKYSKPSYPYIDYFGSRIESIFVSFYIECESSKNRERLRDSLRLLRKSWVSYFPDEVLIRMKEILKQKIGHDVDAMLSDEQIEKLRQYYKSKGLDCDKYLPKPDKKIKKKNGAKPIVQPVMEEDRDRKIKKKSWAGDPMKNGENGEKLMKKRSLQAVNFEGAYDEMNNKKLKLENYLLNEINPTRELLLSGLGGAYSTPIANPMGAGSLVYHQQHLQGSQLSHQQPISMQHQHQFDQMGQMQILNQGDFGRNTAGSMSGGRMMEYGGGGNINLGVAPVNMRMNPMDSFANVQMAGGQGSFNQARLAEFRPDSQDLRQHRSDNNSHLEQGSLNNYSRRPAPQERKPPHMNAEFSSRSRVLSELTDMREREKLHQYAFSLLYLYFKKMHPVGRSEAADTQRSFKKGDVDIDRIVRSLYDEMKYSCSSCGNRFETRVGLMDHLYVHFKVNDARRRKPTKDREPFLSIEQWLNLDTEEKAQSQAKGSNEYFEDIYYVVCGENDKSVECHICGESFKIKWNQNVRKWVYESAVLVQTEEEGSAKTKSTVNMHWDCYETMKNIEEEEN